VIALVTSYLYGVDKMKDSKVRLSIGSLESELDSLIDNDKYFGSISEEVRKLVHKVFFVHARLESELGMRILYKLLDEQLSANQNTSCCLTETMSVLISKLTYMERLNMVRGFKDEVPYSVLEKINSIRNDFGHPIERKWKDKYKSEKHRLEVLQVLVIGIKAMDNYMEKVKEESGA
jgi:Arc/MetJ-type ribon-helix-helix transcriptional regulator